MIFASASFIGCGVPHQEVARRVAAAEQKGYSEGVQTERARCDAKVERLTEEHQQKEAALRSEVSSLENRNTLLKAAAVSAWGVTGLTLAGGLTVTTVFYVRRRRRNADSDADAADKWDYTKPPPSVTQES